MQGMQAAEPQPALLAGTNRRLVTKGEYARLRNITPPRVSQLISEGKIFGAAIVGEGMRAKIDADLANQQLGASLDVTQTLAQQRTLPPDLPLNSDQQRIQKAKAEQAEIAARQARRAESEQAGTLVRVDDVKRAIGRELGELLTGLDGWMIELAAVLTREHGLDQKLTTVLLRRELRLWRQRRADLAASAAQQLPALVEEEPAEVETNG